MFAQNTRGQSHSFKPTAGNRNIHEFITPTHQPLHTHTYIHTHTYTSISLINRTLCSSACGSKKVDFTHKVQFTQPSEKNSAFLKQFEQTSCVIKLNLLHLKGVSRPNKDSLRSVFGLIIMENEVLFVLELDPY